MKREGEHKSTGDGAEAAAYRQQKTDARLSIDAIAKPFISETGCG